MIYYDQHDDGPPRPPDWYAVEDPITEIETVYRLRWTYNRYRPATQTDPEEGGDWSLDSVEPDAGEELWEQIQQWGNENVG